MPEQLQFDFERSEQKPTEQNGAPLMELPRDPSARGYGAFTSEQVAALNELEQRFGLILNKKVRLRLIGWDEEFVGKLVLDQLLPPTDRQEGLRLRIGTMPFANTDIEFCSRVEE